MGFWDLYARVYDAMPRYFAPYQRLVMQVADMVENLCPPGGLVLDAGCGTGNYSIELAGRGFRVHGIDSSDAMLRRAAAKRARAGLVDLTFTRCNIADGLPSLPEGGFDCVISIHALYTLQDPETALAEYLGVLKPSGWLVVSEPQHPIRIAPVLKEARREGGILNAARVFLTQFGVGVCNLLIGRRQSAGAYHYWGREEMRGKLEAAGFRINTMTPAYTDNLDLLVSAVKPGVDLRDGAFRFLKAETRDDLERVLRLRHRVYCENESLLPSSEDGMESDRYDERSTHFLALDGGRNAAGTIRFIPDSPAGLFLDQSHFPFRDYIKDASISRVAEVGRLAVVNEGTDVAVPFGLFRCIYEHASQAGVNDLLATVRPKHTEMHARLGFRQLGEPEPHDGEAGLWTPLHLDIRQVLVDQAVDPDRYPAAKRLIGGSWQSGPVHGR